MRPKAAKGGYISIYDSDKEFSFAEFLFLFIRGVSSDRTGVFAGAQEVIILIFAITISENSENFLKKRGRKQKIRQK